MAVNLPEYPENDYIFPYHQMTVHLKILFVADSTSLCDLVHLSGEIKTALNTYI